MNKAIRLAVPLVCLAWVAGCGARPRGGTGGADQNVKGKSVVVVFAAASAANALDVIQAAFCKGTGAEVRTSCAATSTLAQQTVNGAEADIFISADVKWADHVEAKHLALADPDAVPAGKHAKQALTKLYLWSKVKGKVAPAEAVRHALTCVDGNRNCSKLRGAILRQT